MFKEKGMNLRKWTTNRKTLRKQIDKDRQTGAPTTMKVLRLHWNSDSDTLKLV